MLTATSFLLLGSMAAGAEVPANSDLAPLPAVQMLEGAKPAGTMPSLDFSTEMKVSLHAVESFTLNGLDTKTIRAGIKAGIEAADAYRLQVINIARQAD